MTDQDKRETLKHIAAVGVGMAAFATSSGVLAHSVHKAGNSTSLAATPADDGLIDIHIGTRLASNTNDLEVVITNASNTEATITDMTPAEINTARGRFDFNTLFDSGELRLKASESIIVPIQHHTVVLDGSSVDERAAELTQSLRRNVSVIINGDSLAVKTITNFVHFA